VSAVPALPEQGVSQRFRAAREGDRAWRAAARPDRERVGHEALTAQLAATPERYRTLFETLPQGVIYYAADGMVLGANPAAGTILGLDPEEVMTWPLPWHAVHEDGSPFQPGEFPVAVALRTGEIVPDTVVGVPHGRTGELRWLGITVIPDARDEDGRSQRAYAMFRDLTKQRRTEATLREGAELMGRLRDANVLGVVVNGGDRVHEANDAFLEMIGYSRDELAAGCISGGRITAPEWVVRDLEARQQLLRTGSFRPYEKEYLHRDGHRVPVLVGGALVSRSPRRWVTYVVDLTARQRAEEERAALLARERAARAEAEIAQERVSFLLRAGDLVAAAQDRHELLRHAAQLVVHSLADFCVVFLPADDGTLRATSAAYRRPGLAPAVVFADLRDQAGPALAQREVAAAYTTGTSQVVPNLVGRLIQHDVSPPIRDLMGTLNPETALITPLMGGQRPQGVLVVGRSADRPALAPADVAVVEELARQTAVGLANAAAFVRDHSIAETLQRSVLPDALPVINGLDLAVRYLPGTDGAEVGGDWYDAFPLGNGRVGLVIGDVVGHNIGSASIMGQLRNMLRAYAVDHECPAEVLRHTASAVSQLLPEALATVVYAVLDMTTGELSYANAGHPPPVCCPVSAAPGYLDAATGVMLGAPWDGAFTVGYRKLGPGTSLLLYTDGLIEDRRRNIADGLGALASAMSEGGARTAEEVCAVVQTALLASSQRADDVCLLAARLTGGSIPAWCE
jgi:PAS domain S-box-containing protein